MPSQVFHQSFYSNALGSHKKYMIYLPPGVSQQKGGFPVLYLMSGLMDYERTWCDRGNLPQAADYLLNQGKMGEMVVVMPDKDNAATQTDQEMGYGYYLAFELVDHIEKNYPVSNQPTARGIEGLSLGSFWALNLALHTPGKYKSVGSSSGNIYPDFYEAVEQNLESLKALKTRFRFSCGTQEEREMIESNAHFNIFLQHKGFYSEFYLEAGPHDWPLWQKDIYSSLQFHSYSFFHG
ncbi:MAG: alpha/beta hydrolase-fold protein [Planctomycetota bacterium]